jgi:hypothetical protein
MSDLARELIAAGIFVLESVEPRSKPLTRVS